ncbi:hypothetical protein AMTRI_Chr13g124070 [Amborella trichopoda]
MLSFGFKKSPRITFSHNLLIKNPCFNPIIVIIFLYQIIVFLPKAFIPSPTSSPLLPYLSRPPLFSHFFFYISDHLSPSLSLCVKSHSLHLPFSHHPPSPSLSHTF